MTDYLIRGGTSMPSVQSLFNFEKILSQYTGAPYVVATDGCNHGMELVLRLLDIKKLDCPGKTYLSVIQMLIDLGIDFSLTDEHWAEQGEHRFGGTNIWDSARRFEKDMYEKGQIKCISFGNSKPLHIGKVGAILLDDKDMYEKLSMMRSDGRDLKISPWGEQMEYIAGYHYCPTFEDCDKGIKKMEKNDFVPMRQNYWYPDCRNFKIAGKSFK
jgi:dTDP-4-amino-4,6-dideoxygalactose transaminase